jgi:hypothetical protein
MARPIPNFWKDGDAEDPVANAHPPFYPNMNGRETAILNYAEEAAAVVAWASGKTYFAGKVVTNGGHTYVAIDAHTSGGSFSADSTHWTLLPIAAVDIGAQPADSDLAAIAALTTTPFGRNLLTLADAAAARSALALGTAAAATLNPSGALGTSDLDVPTQQAVKTYVDLHGGGVTTADGTTFGIAALNGAGEPEITFTSEWGIDASTGEPYFDPAGALSGEDALLIVAEGTGELVLIRPEGAAP